MDGPLEEFVRTPVMFYDAKKWIVITHVAWTMLKKNYCNEIGGKHFCMRLKVWSYHVLETIQSNL